MKDRKPKLLSTLGRGLVLIAFTMHVLAIAIYWWGFDPRLSCERLPGWGEWISCMHGSSHVHITMAETAVVCWLIAGITLVLGRSVPFYISIILPVAIIGCFIWGTIVYWHQDVTSYMPFGETTLSQKMIFTVNVGMVFIYVVLPAAGAWLLGMNAREARSTETI